MKSKASPYGSEDVPLNPTLMSLSHGASFVARLFAGHPEQIAEVLMEGTQHEGYAFFHIYSTCLTFDKAFKTWENLKKWVHPLPESHDPTDRRQAFDEALADDLNTAAAFAEVFGLAREANAALAAGGLSADKAAKVREAMFRMVHILGLDATASEEAEIPAEIIQMAEERQRCRAAGDYARADSLRSAIGEQGYEVRDVPDGFKVVCTR